MTAANDFTIDGPAGKLTLLLYGSEAAKQDYMQGGIPRNEFFERLAARDKSFVIVPDCGDDAHLELPRRVIYDRVAAFLHGK